jgi:two-component system CheB/CheR fusion protein
MNDGRRTQAVERARFPVVGIGASAGGLSALEAFFSAQPNDAGAGMAYVLVQHLAPDRESALSELLGRCTTMPVVDVEDGVAVQPDHVYVIPPDRDLALLDGTLQLLEPTAPRGLRLSIDFFFRSLAQDQREFAVCIVLSGTGSDGALGLRAVKGDGGLTIAQEPSSAAYEGMPQSAIATGCVDAILEPEEMLGRLSSYARLRFGDHPAGVPSAPLLGEDTLRKICLRIRAHTGHDFSQYKQTTLVRRIARRMALHQLEREEDYLRFLQKHSVEIEALFADLLIGVTRFFRDPAAFTALETEVLPALLERRAGGTLRLWVAGCSTGEEAYSIAMVLQELLASAKRHCAVQIFASDIDAEAIAQARGGVYPAAIAADVSPERLERFFVKDAESDVYRVTKLLRDQVIFSEQDLIKDPPFSKLDLISCRNLLIYMTSQLQKKLIPLFHYALAPEGALFLGSSETVGEFASLFEAIDRQHKLYKRRSDVASGATRLALPAFPERVAPGTLALEARGDSRRRGKANLGTLTERALLDHHAHVGVLINGRGEILHIYGRTGHYLEPTPGDAQMNILKMAREGLRRPLTMALHKAVSERAVVHKERLKVRSNGASELVDVVVRPLHETTEVTAESDLWLVVIVPRTEVADEASVAEGDDTRGAESDERAAALEQELRAKEEYLQTTLEEMETSNEELKSTNEELQSVNEELQSSNEELETSKEELQSVNEELATVNAELQTKVSELSRTNNDMNNLLAGTGVGTLFVDHQLRIARFTPAATQVINLIQTDVGRPVGHVVSNLIDYQDLVRDAQAVLDSLAPLEREVQTTDGRWYLMRIRPYRTLDNVIEGVVITFVDISSRRLAELAHREAEAFAASIVSAVREPLIVLDEALRVVDANAAYYRTFAITKGETVGRSLYELNEGQWDLPALRELLEQVLPDNQSFDDLEVEHRLEGAGGRSFKLNARRITRSAEQGDLILLAIEGER